MEIITQIYSKFKAQLKQHNVIPPRWLLAILRFFLRESYLEEIEGDLEELFQVNLKHHSIFKSRLIYNLEVLKMFRPSLFKRFFRFSYSNPAVMFNNHFKTSMRHIRFNKSWSAINIAGLSAGITVTLLISLWIADELTFNHYHINHKQIAQVMQHRTHNGTINTRVAVPLTLDAALRQEFGSDFKHIALASWTGNHILAVGAKNVSFTGNFMGAEGPSLFSLRMLGGSEDALRDPSSILLSKSAATALFTQSDPTGQLIKLDNQSTLKVGGIYEDLPQTSSLHDLMFIAPWENYAATHEWVKKAIDNWGENSFQLYVQLADHASLSSVSDKIKDIKLNHVDREDSKYNPVIFLHPMDKWHLYAEFRNGINTGGAIQSVWLFGMTGVFVLLLACINFMNLSTARSEKRAREVGIRKAIGSLRKQLISQFYTESLLMSSIAYIISLLLLFLVLPFFNQLADKQLSIPWTNPVFWIAGIWFTAITGIIAGSYPAVYLSSFNPVKVLKGTFKAGRFTAIPRQVLIVFQFTVSVILIIGTLTVFNQIQYSKIRPIGYSRNGLILTAVNNDFQNHFEAVKSDLLGSGVFSSVARSTSPLTAIHNTKGDVYWSLKEPSATYDFAMIQVTTDYGKTIGWELAAGRDFSSQLATDSSGLILNEAAVSYMGLKSPVGTIVRFNNTDHTVIGVTKNLVMESPYEAAKPTLFHLHKSDFDYVILKINPAASTHDAINKLASIYKTYSPDTPFSYHFADADYAVKFINEERTGKIAGLFAILAIFISCLGLFGMATFMAEQRIKEIGVRKVLGASVFSLWGLLTKDLVKLVFIALILAMPLAYYLMHRWLQYYEYRSKLAWWVFAAAGTGAIIFTVMTISFQSIRAALISPVRTLRTE